MVCAGWGAWAVFAVAVVAELLGRAGKRPPRRLGGMSRLQRLVAEWITAITLIVGGAQTAGASPLHTTAPPPAAAQHRLVTSTARVVGHGVADRDDGPGEAETFQSNGKVRGPAQVAVASAQHASPAHAVFVVSRNGAGRSVAPTRAEVAQPTVTVADGDSLWKLAGLHLPPLGLRGNLRVARSGS